MDVFVLVILQCESYFGLLMTAIFVWQAGIKNSVIKGNMKDVSLKKYKFQTMLCLVCFLIRTAKKIITFSAFVIICHESFMIRGRRWLVSFYLVFNMSSKPFSLPSLLFNNFICVFLTQKYKSDI